MTREHSTATRCTLMRLFVLASLICVSGAQIPAPATSAVPTAAQRFKNIRVLKDMPADRLFPAMNFIAASLNVDCSFCHVDGPDFDKDDKKNKQTARKMMEMELAINQASFNGESMVTCDTCHRGSRIPASLPVLTLEKEAPEIQPAPTEVTAAKVLNKYVQALGGLAGIQSLTSYVETGAYSSSIMPGVIPFEAYAKTPDQRLEVLHYPDGDTLTGYSHQRGWTQRNPGSPVYEMSPTAAEYFSYFADLLSAEHLQQRFSELSVASARIGEGETYMVIGRKPGQQSMTFYFDKRSGLLVRAIRYSQTPLGANPVQIDYADYRAVGGTKLPFRQTFAQSGSQYTIQITSIQHNVSLADSSFTEPH